MKLRYEKKFTLTTGMLDEHELLKPHSILDLFQEIAGEHAEILGCGKTFCDKNNYGWIMARQEIRIIKMPKSIKEIIVSTFPHPANRIEFIREYEMKTIDGEVLVRGGAVWVLLDFQTRRMLRDNNLYPIGEYEAQNYFDNKINKPKSVFQNGELVTEYIVTKSDIDTYHHMNNARYANMLYDYSIVNYEDIKAFAISYHQEIKLNERMNIYRLMENNNIYITGIKDDKIIFTSVLEKGE